MSLGDLGRDWETLAREDPLWAVYVRSENKGKRWDLSLFLQTGEDEITRSQDLLQRLGRTLDGVVVDFGCGVGRLSRPLSSYADHVVGIDIAPTMLTTAKAVCVDRPNIDFVLNDSPSLPLGTSTVDIVYSSLVLQHMPKRLALLYLADFLRVLRPGGLAVVQVATRAHYSPKGLASRLLPMSWNAVLQQRVLGYPAPMRMGTLRLSEIDPILQSHGSKVIAIEADDSYGGHWDYTRFVILAGGSRSRATADKVDSS
jgi:ubiquinone/menaquinone biosynthesis C-methylase UbiE